MLRLCAYTLERLCFGERGFKISKNELFSISNYGACLLGVKGPAKNIMPLNKKAEGTSNLIVLAGIILLLLVTVFLLYFSGILQAFLTIVPNPLTTFLQQNTNK